jgi:hypothetical protein
MKGISIVAFAASAILAVAFFVSKVYHPTEDLLPIKWFGDWLLPLAYIFGALGIVAGACSRNIPEGIWAVISGVAGAFAAVFIVLQFVYEHQRSVDRATLELFSNLEGRRPPNSRFCRCALYHLFNDADRTSLDQLLERKDVQLSSLAMPFVNSCLSDIKSEERELLIKETRLSPQGASFFADRVARVLNLDDDIAFAVRYDLVRPEILSVDAQKSMEVAKAVATLYKEKLGFEGFSNVRIASVEVPKQVCSNPNAF